jgi:hypothetical protein
MSRKSNSFAARKIELQQPGDSIELQVEQQQQQQQHEIEPSRPREDERDAGPKLEVAGSNPAGRAKSSGLDRL